MKATVARRHFAHEKLNVYDDYRSRHRVQDTRDLGLGVFMNEFESLLACPYEWTPLTRDERVLRCPNGHIFPVVGDVPVLLRSDVPQTIGLASNSLKLAWADAEGRNADPLFVDSLGISDEQKNGVRIAASRRYDVDPVVSHLVSATNGILYKH